MYVCLCVCVWERERGCEWAGWASLCREQQASKTLKLENTNSDPAGFQK
jgi:hypothetical protein